MKILALEFSTSERSVAIFDGKAQRILSTVKGEFGGKTGMTLIGEALRASALEPGAIELIAVGLGPGSNAGIRSAISIAQGWHLAQGVPVVGIARSEADAVEILARLAAQRAPFDPSRLEPISDREVDFVKAPRPRSY